MNDEEYSPAEQCAICERMAEPTALLDDLVYCMECLDQRQNRERYNNVGPEKPYTPVVRDRYMERY